MSLLLLATVVGTFSTDLSSIGAPLANLDPYIESIGLDVLTQGMQRDELDKAFDEVETYAAENGRGDLKETVEALRREESDKREVLEREVFPEVSPVLETTGKVKKRTAEEMAAIEGQARFAIQNLRGNLAPLQNAASTYARQMALERASYEAAEKDIQETARKIEEANLKDVTDAQRMQSGVLQAWMNEWYHSLTEYLEQDIAEMRQRVESAKPETLTSRATKWGPLNGMKEDQMLIYLATLPPKRLALITILELMRMIGSGGVNDGMKLLRGVMGVGRAIEAEYRADMIRSIAGEKSRLWQQVVNPQTQKPLRTQIEQTWKKIGRDREKEANESASGDAVNGGPESDLRAVWTPPWSGMVQMSIGTHLVEALIKTARVVRHGTDPLTGEEVTEKQPAFAHSFEYVRGKKLGVVKANPVVAKRLANDSVRHVISPKHLPMLVPPNPWKAWNQGPYLTIPTTMMRFKDSIEQRSYLEAASKSGHLEPVFHGLDVLSSTPWRINRNVFEVVLKAWNNGDAIADIPATEEKSDIVIPEKPEDPNDPVKRHEYVLAMKTLSLQQRKNHAERCKYNYNLEIARSYINDVFYIPHNLDFRGRAYPIPPHLSPVGDDLCRGLLTFGVKKPLGENGLRWLQIHLANLYGFDKASFDERVQFAKDHVEDIFDSADNPLDGKRWWLAAEDPWQCLAACFELTAALRSEDPTKFESSLPVHQDGTCNGMQHYAALGGDVRGAKAVNLEQGDRPADIYSTVLALVNESIEEDQKKGVPTALLIKNPLGRKVVKQTVMTTVYGVTFVGARDQIAKQLRARGDMSSDDVWVTSAYIAKKVLNSIGSLFWGARAIQDWLTNTARLISRAIPADRLEQATSNAVEKQIRPGPKNKKQSRLAKELMTSVVWTSPLGLPVVQPYRKPVKKQVMTSLQTVFISDPNAPSEVSPQKQATAFPPNFVHSLDATHMLLTAVACNQSNITFASVHDSYWTHASTVEPMSEVIRDSFIHLHSNDIIGKLREEFIDRYKDHYIPLNRARELSKKAAERAEALAELKREKGDTDATAVDPTDPDAAEEAEEEDLKPGEEGVNASEVNGAPTVKINGREFVRFLDCLPPTPPRGEFDVQKIRQSKYFFS